MTELLVRIGLFVAGMAMGGTIMFYLSVAGKHLQDADRTSEDDK